MPQVEEVFGLHGVEEFGRVLVSSQDGAEYGTLHQVIVRKWFVYRLRQASSSSSGLSGAAVRSRASRLSTSRLASKNGAGTITLDLRQFTMQRSIASEIELPFRAE